MFDIYANKHGPFRAADGILLSGYKEKYNDKELIWMLEHYSTASIELPDPNSRFFALHQLGEVIDEMRRRGKQDISLKQCDIASLIWENRDR